MFKRLLFEIKDDIKKHEQQDMFSLVEQRLTKTLNLYVFELEHSYNSLVKAGELRVLKQLSKEV